MSLEVAFVAVHHDVKFRGFHPRRRLPGSRAWCDSVLLEHSASWLLDPHRKVFSSNPKHDLWPKIQIEFSRIQIV